MPGKSSMNRNIGPTIFNVFGGTVTILFSTCYEFLCYFNFHVVQLQKIWNFLLNRWNSLLQIYAPKDIFNEDTTRGKNFEQKDLLWNI